MTGVGDLVPDHEYFRDFLDAEQSAQLMDSLVTTTPWRDDVITLFGRTHLVPRRTALFGDPGARYTYSRIVMDPLPWPDNVLEIRQQIEAIADASFNAVLVNLYRNGRDSNGWHSDDEAELGQNPVIASVSLGAPRTMKFKRRDGSARWSVVLEPGSLLVMRGDSQSSWLHTVPKEVRVREPRVNLTFRYIATST